MRADWTRLHASLLTHLNRHTTHRSFLGMRQRNAALDPFADVIALIDHLHGSEGDLEAKNAILTALVQEARSGVPPSTEALTILHIALWPGLDAVYRRRLRHFRDAPEALASEVSARFVEAVQCCDPHRVSRIAATLVRNVDRDIGRMLAARWAEEARCAPPDQLASVEADPRSAGFSDPDRASRHLRDRLVPIIGRDAGLVMDVAICGVTQAEAAQVRGISHDAARKRYRRALRRLAPHFREECSPHLSHSAARTGVSPLTPSPQGPMPEEN